MFALLLAACAPDLTPSWAYDPIWLEPAPAAGVHGFHTWQLYGPGWDEKFDDRHFVCAVVVELEGTPVACEAEDGCEHAWAISPTVLESDCADPVLADDPLFTSLVALALGGPATGAEVPWPGSTSVGYADYGNGWEVHGDAYPEVLDHGADAPVGSAPAEWDGVEPFQFVPSAAFPYPS